MPLFEKGNKKGPGRPKGSVVEAMRLNAKDVCEAHAFNPFEKLIDLAMNCKSAHVQFSATAELASYLAPKLRQIDFSKGAQIPFTINFNPPSSKDNKDAGSSS